VARNKSPKLVESEGTATSTAVAAASFLEKGLKPVPLHAKTKKPIFNKWQDRWATPKQLAQDFSNPTQNIGIQWGSVSNNHVDIDLDSPVALDLADEFLPPTDSVFGRKSTPRAHRIYRVDDTIRTKKYRNLDPINEAKSLFLELRGEAAQTMCPPSTHPNGEVLKWDCNGQPAQISAIDLSAAVGNLAAACLLAEQWPGEGERHEFALTLSGFLAKSGFPIDDTRHLVEVICSHVGDTEVDDRLRCVDDTYEAFESGKPTAGRGRLIDIVDKPAVKLLTNWLGFASSQQEIVDELNSKHAVVLLGNRVAILTEIPNPTTGKIDVQFLRQTDFKLLYANRFTLINNKPVCIAVYWMKHAARRAFESVMFYPGDTPDSVYNLWREFAVQPREGDCQLYLDHIRDTICRGDSALFQYVLAWMADAVQTPANRPGIALVLRGRMGTGKGVFCREFGALFGQHFTQVSQSRHLTGNFNAHLKDCLLLYADEAFWAGDKQSEGVLKALVTEPTFMLENKGFDAVAWPNYVRLLISSNNEWVVPAGMEERRFVVLDLSDARMKDITYFKAVVEQMENGGREALLYFLLKFDLSDVELRDLPKTAALDDQKRLSMTPIQSWWIDKLERGAILQEQDEWRDWIPTDELYHDYATAVGKAGKHYKGDLTSFGMQLKKLIPGLRKPKRTIDIYLRDPAHPSERIKKSQRRPGYAIPPLDTCRAHFDNLVGNKIDWPKEDDDDAHRSETEGPDEKF